MPTDNTADFESGGSSSEEEVGKTTSGDETTRNVDTELSGTVDVVDEDEAVSGDTGYSGEGTGSLNPDSDDGASDDSSPISPGGGLDPTDGQGSRQRDSPTSPGGGLDPGDDSDFSGSGTSGESATDTGTTSSTTETAQTPSQDQTFADEGLEEQYGNLGTGRTESRTGQAVQQLQSRIGRTTPGVNATDTDLYNIVREGDRLRAEFAAEAERRAAEQALERDLQRDTSGVPDAPTQAEIERAEDPSELPGVVAAPGGGYRIAPAVAEAERAEDVQEQAQALREDVAADVSYADASDVEVSVEDGRLVASTPAPEGNPARRGTEANRIIRRRIASESEGLRPDEVDVVQTNDGLAYQRDGALIGASDEEFDFGSSEVERDVEASAAQTQSVDEALGSREGQVTTADRRAPVDVALAGSASRRIANAQDEQFGDVDWSLGLGGPEDEVERAAEELAKRADELTAGADERLPQSGGQDPTQAAAVSTGTPGNTVSYSPAQLGGRALDAVGNIGEAPKEAAEIAETAGYITGQVDNDGYVGGGVVGFASDPEQTQARSAQTTAVGQRVAQQTVEDVQQDPRGAAGQVFVGGTIGLAAGGALSKVPGVPGSDLSGRAVSAAARATRRTPDINAPSASGVRNPVGAVRDRTPTVRVESDPEAGVLEIDPELKSAIRDRTVGRAERTATAARNAPLELRRRAAQSRTAVSKLPQRTQAAIGTAARGTQRRAADAFDRAARANLRAERRATKAQIKLQDAPNRVVNRVDNAFDRAARANLEAEQRATQARQRFEERGYQAARSVAGLPSDARLRAQDLLDRDPATLGEVTQQAKARAGDAFDRAARANLRAERRATKAQIKLQDAPNRVVNRVDNAFDRAARANLEAEQRATQARQRFEERGYQAARGIAAAPASARQRAGELLSLDVSDLGAGVPDVRGRAAREAVALRFRAAEAKRDLTSAASDARDLTIRVGEPERSSIVDTDAGEPAIRSQLDDEFGLDTDVDGDSFDSVDVEDVDADADAGRPGGAVTVGGDSGTGVQRVVVRSDQDRDAPAGPGSIDTDEGLLGPASGVAGIASSGSFIGEAELSGGDAAVGPDVFDDTPMTNADDVTEPFAGGEADIGLREDAGVTTAIDVNAGIDTGMDLGARVGTRQDTPQDSAQDVEFRQDLDLRQDLGLRQDIDNRRRADWFGPDVERDEGGGGIDTGGDEQRFRYEAPELI
jgi:hypothetical protein